MSFAFSSLSEWIFFFLKMVFLFHFNLEGHVWHNVGHLLRGCGCQSEDPFVLARNPYKRACAWDLLQDWKRTREGRSQSRRDQGREQNRAVGRREQELEPVNWNAKLAYGRGWVSIPGDFVGVSLEYTLTIAKRMLGKCHKLLPSCAWS